MTHIRFQKTVRSAFLAASFTALLAGCGSMNLGGAEEQTDAAKEASAQTQTTQSSPNTMTVAAAERKSVLVCVVQDPKQNVEALERAVVEGVKATGVTARVVKAGDNVSACKGLMTYGVATKDGKLTGMVYQMNEGNKVALRATGPAKDGKMTLHQAASYAANFVLYWLNPKPAAEEKPAS
ncbi:MAG TPA: hypothetical protein IAA02_06765 [Candidatus Sutterella merdavium]|nr:hypothetical protein [Candidatus Sutterella merdavium]